MIAPSSSCAPVAMLVFNRPRVTQRVFDAVAAARPARLLVVADGPRTDRPEDVRLCRETRSIVENVSWPCELLTNYSDVNIGCKERILSGLDWVFSNVSEAIILEDDCLPEPSFFPYCDEMLARYRKDEHIHMVRGGNFLAGRRPVSSSYYFSRWYHIWGWATWARAWNQTDRAMERWPDLRDGDWLERRLPMEAMAERARQIFEDAHAGRVTTWEYHFTFMGWARDAMAIAPVDNLVTNIGFGPDAAHYTTEKHAHALLPTSPIRFPLRHPREVRISEKADLLEWKLVHPGLLPKSLWRRARGYARRQLANLGHAR